ncbi:glycosyltransferase family 2 protein [Ursidibacter arcticus]
MTEFNPIAIIPHYNHSATVGKVAEKLQQLGLPVLIVDDGSSDEHKTVLERFPQSEWLFILFCETNGGKGMAVKTGLKRAQKLGFSHAIQVDADGQHQLEDSIKLLEDAKVSPNSLICGAPVYGDDAPKVRLYGRKITNFWIAINTLSLTIKDGMCGFRLYPIKPTVDILEQEFIGNQMDFDVELLVHCVWRKIPIVWVDTPVKYEIGNISHFRGWADNWLISKMHARLFFGMLKRLFTGKIR